MEQKTIALLIDDSRGIYIPALFYRNFDFESWGLTRIHFKDLQAPSNEKYWDAWDELLTDAEMTDKDGHKWTLHQDGDLFAVRDDHNWDEKGESA